MGTVTDVISKIDDIGETIIVHLIMGYLIAQSGGFVGLPVINVLVEQIVSVIVDFLISKAKILKIDLATIIQISGQDSKFTKTAQALLDAQKDGVSDADRAKAKKDLLDAARAFGAFKSP